MAALFPPASMLRKGSLQPPSPEYYGTPRLTRASTGQLWHLLRGNASLNDTTTSILRNSWNSSDGNIESTELRRGSSSSSLKPGSPCLSSADEYDFIIPRSHSLQRQLNLANTPVDLGKLDINQYIASEEVDQEYAFQTKIGHITFSINYNKDEGKLKITLKSTEIFLKPSASVIGCDWSCEPVTFMDFFPNIKRPLEISYGVENSLSLKKEELSDKTLRFSIYDVKRKHNRLAIGHVLFPLREISDVEKVNIFSKKINFYSQPAGFNKGSIEISLAWISLAQRLDIKIGQASKLKSPYGAEGNDHYAKLDVFIFGKKEKSFKTSTQKAKPDINFREKFSVPLSSSQLKDSTIACSIYMKHTMKKMILNKILTGKTIIGPYMLRGEKTFTQWENVIANPSQEFTEVHTLYL
ncbi:synaptotagmin-15 isoform X1 [Hydra vulgaris]|uniref:synaptotagmin-15 isoform X1 n=1 Tax=Hydra vulgaris TaxID=6087 RepID=UPI00064151C8|nr:synaptotagmin-15 isoform X1 [Hydra vulgaris]XP_047124839.1 synaptotagmin-15 isoform X1 [Hydra vulgaris]XP_047124840.1 synaptotagmin-15 isoform X1 [Hydra vulgaris]